MSPPRGVASFARFWPVYLREHRCTRCRALHYVAATASIGVAVAAACARSWWLLLAAPVTGYGFAWLGHACFERNRPATWRHPWWSLRAEWRMFALALTGRLRRHIEQAEAERDDAT